MNYTRYEYSVLSVANEIHSTIVGTNGGHCSDFDRKVAWLQWRVQPSVWTDPSPAGQDFDSRVRELALAALRLYENTNDTGAEPLKCRTEHCTKCSGKYGRGRRRGLSGVLICDSCWGLLMQGARPTR